MVPELERSWNAGEDVSREALLGLRRQTDHSLNRLTKLVNDMLDIARSTSVS